SYGSLTSDSSMWWRPCSFVCGLTRRFSCRETDFQRHSAAALGPFRIDGGRHLNAPPACRQVLVTARLDLFEVVPKHDFERFGKHGEARPLFLRSTRSGCRIVAKRSRVMSATRAVSVSSPA